MASLPAGTLLGSGRYRVCRELQRGGTAVVYAGEDLAVGGAPVALKVLALRGEGPGAPRVPTTVLREVQYASQLCHEAIVRLLDFFPDGQHMVLVVRAGCAWHPLLGARAAFRTAGCGGAPLPPTGAMHDDGA